MREIEKERNIPGKVKLNFVDRRTNSPTDRETDKRRNLKYFIKRIEVQRLASR